MQPANREEYEEEYKQAFPGTKQVGRHRDGHRAPYIGARDPIEKDANNVVTSARTGIFYLGNVSHIKHSALDDVPARASNPWSDDEADTREGGDGPMQHPLGCIIEVIDRDDDSIHDDQLLGRGSISAR